jgi:ribosomal protein L35AE/L33A
MPRPLRSSLLLPFPVLLLVASASWAAPVEYDAFLSERADRPVPELKAFATSADRFAVEGQVSSTEPRLGVPTFFWAWRPAPGQRTLRDMGLSAAQAARRHLAAHAALYRTTPGHVAEVRVTRVHDLGDQGAVIVQFEQDVRGVRVFRDEVKVIMTPGLELVAISGALTPQLKTMGQFDLAPETALTVAFQDLMNTGHEPVTLKSLGAEGSWTRFQLNDEPTPARARQVWYPHVNGVEPAWQLELDVSTGTDGLLYSYVVSARDGAVLTRHSLKAADAYSYRVWADSSPTHFPLDGPQGGGSTPHPTGLADKWQAPFVPPTLVSLANGPISTNDAWLPAGASTTVGNNVKAYLDLKAPNGFAGGDVLGTVSAAGAFDYTYDPLQGPGANATQQQASVQQLFYTNNFLHDWYYDVGFDEKSGNAQQANFGRGGGQGNDPIMAEGQDYSGTENANMSTPADGASPRMQMYVWPGLTSHTMTVASTPVQTFAVGSAQFGPQLFDVSAPMELVDDGSSAGGGTPTDGCQAYPGPVTGHIAVVDRGQCTFVIKVQNAQAAGAVGIIIIDNEQADLPIGMAGTAATTIPAYSVTMASGDLLRPLAGAVNATMTAVQNVTADGTIDNSIVAHEWGHYIAHRLIGDSSGLGNQQAGGMGEGWSDFHAMLLLVRPEDAQVATNHNWSGVYGLAGYVGYMNWTPYGYYFGIRRMPYSTDLAKNQLTFKHIEKGIPIDGPAPMLFGSSGASNEEVHNAGEVWAQMLWEGYAALLNDSRYTFAQAQDRMRGYLVASYKATPLMPTFIDARDALLSVAAAKDNGDFGLLWRAFAKRGIGMGAVAPPRESLTNSPVTESFMVGNALVVAHAAIDDSTHSCDNDGQLDANETGVLTVQVRNVGIGEVTGAQLSVSSMLEGLTFPSGTTAVLPAVKPFETTTVKLPVAMSNVAGVKRGTVTVTLTEASLIKSPVVDSPVVAVNFDLKPNATATDDVEAPMSQWTSGADPKGDTGTVFKRYEDSGSSHWWYAPSSAFNSDVYLVSPPLQVSTGLPFIMTFKHRFTFEQEAVSATLTANLDGAVLELSEDDGATWTDIGAQSQPGYTGTVSAIDGTKQSSNTLDGKRAWTGVSANSPMFVTETVNLGTKYQGKTVKVRFHQATDDSLGEKGWEVDDVGFAGIINKPFTAVVSDPNTCTNKAPVVTLGADQEVLEGATVTLGATATDADNDPLTRTWTQTSGALVTLTGETFTAPSVKADTLIIFELTVSDGRAVVGPLTSKVLVKTKNKAPTATATATVSVAAGSHVTLDGAGTDPDGDPVTFAWTQVSGPGITFKDASAAKAEFDAPKDANQTLVLQLVASDGNLSSAPVTVEVKVKNACGCGTGAEGGLAIVALLGLLRRRRRS